MANELNVVLKNPNFYRYSFHKNELEIVNLENINSTCSDILWESEQVYLSVENILSIVFDLEDINNKGNIYSTRLHCSTCATTKSFIFVKVKFPIYGNTYLVFCSIECFNFWWGTKFPLFLDNYCFVDAILKIQKSGYKSTQEYCDVCGLKKLNTSQESKNLYCFDLIDKDGWPMISTKKQFCSIHCIENWKLDSITQRLFPIQKSLIKSLK